MYAKCGEAWRRRYVQKEIIPPGVAAVKGISLHKGSEYNFTSKLETKVDRPVKDIVDYSVSTLEEKIKAEGLTLIDEEEERGKKSFWKFPGRRRI
jgi:hypothetical protein